MIPRPLVGPATWWRRGLRRSSLRCRALCFFASLRRALRFFALVRLVLFLAQRREPMRRAANFDRWRIERYCGVCPFTARTARCSFLCSRGRGQKADQNGFRLYENSRGRAHWCAAGHFHAGKRRRVRNLAILGTEAHFLYFEPKNGGRARDSDCRGVPHGR